MKPSVKEKIEKYFSSPSKIVLGGWVIEATVHAGRITKYLLLFQIDKGVYGKQNAIGEHCLDIHTLKYSTLDGSSL